MLTKNELKKLNREEYEFNSMTPQDALNYIIDEICEDEDDERLSDAIKRLQQLIDELKESALDSREVASGILSDTSLINEDYFNMEDYLTNLLDGEEIDMPKISSAQKYAIIQDVEDRLTSYPKFDDFTSDDIVVLADNILNNFDTQSYDEYLNKIIRCFVERRAGGTNNGNVQFFSK